MLPIFAIRFLMHIYTPIKYKQEQLFRWYLSFIPTYIQQVFYIQDKSNYIEEIYNYIHMRPWCDKDKIKIKESGYYLFTYWNTEKYSIERIILHTDHLKKALNLTDLNNLWAFNEKALIKILYEYQEKYKSENILDLFLNNENVYHTLIKYIPSMRIPNNITARIIYILKQCETKIVIDLKQEEFRVIYYTDQLDELHKKDDEYLITM